ncbi:hypothetical protein YC2023_092626 [Brassica napus]
MLRVREKATISTDASEVSPQHKKKSKNTNEEEASPLWSSLPDAVALSCLARLTKSDHVAVSLVSKRHRSLVAAPELCISRWLIGCTEASQYVCLHIFPNPNPSWFVLTETRRLRPIPSNPYQAPESSSFVVVDWGIYVLGGIINHCPTSEVWFLDCFSHTWSRVPSMNMPRASASASLVDGKIYVFGGCGGDDSNSSNWAEVFDPKTQTWRTFVTPNMSHSIDQSAVIQGKKVYAVDEEDQSFYFLPSECPSWTRGKRDTMPGYRSDCEVKGLEELQESFCGSRHVMDYGKKVYEPCKPTKTDIKYDISKLCCNSAGNIVIFWNTQLEYPEGLELRSAEISLERHEGGEIWGKIEWSGVILRDDPLSYSFSLKVLYSAPVYS